MIPFPLHPAAVHFPIAIAMLLPIASLSAAIAIRRGAGVRATWLPVLALSALLSLSAWVAVQTGEREEGAVEDVVAEALIHEHEERAELFSFASAVVLGLVVAALAAGSRGNLLRGVATLATLALWVPAYRVGHSGGELVYTHGAASVYVTAADSDTGPASEGEGDAQAREREARAH